MIVHGAAIIFEGIVVLVGLCRVEVDGWTIFMALRDGMGSVGLYIAGLLVVLVCGGDMGECDGVRIIVKVLGEGSLIVAYWMASKKYGNWGSAE